MVESEPIVTSYDVANTLFILADSLGKNYIEKGESPFEDSYKISEKLIKKVIENKETKDKIVAPIFMENSNDEIKILFNNSMEINDEIITNLSQMLLQGDFDKEEQLKQEVEEMLTLLKARKMLLKIDIEKLANLKENSLDMYVELVGLGKRIEEIMEDSYTKKLEKELIIQNLLEYARGLARINIIKEKQIDLQKNKIQNKIQDNNFEINNLDIQKNNQNIQNNNEFIQ